MMRMSHLTHLGSQWAVLLTAGTVTLVGCARSPKPDIVLEIDQVDQRVEKTLTSDLLNRDIAVFVKTTMPPTRGYPELEFDDRSAGLALASSCETHVSQMEELFGGGQIREQRCYFPIAPERRQSDWGPFWEQTRTTYRFVVFIEPRATLIRVRWVERPQWAIWRDVANQTGGKR